MKELVAVIKGKRELRDLDDSFVRSEVRKFFRSHPELSSTSNRRSADFKVVVKGVRAVLRRVTGSFKDNVSVRERVHIYRSLYKKLFAVTGKPSSVLDLGCGLNPLTFCDPSVYYVANDVSQDVLNQVDVHFNKCGVRHKLILGDLLRVKEKADVCFLFKVFDVIDRGRGHKVSESLLKSLQCAWVVVSFPTVTLSGRPMRFPYRGWVEQMLNRLKYGFQVLEFENEIFYIIRKTI